MIFYINGNNNGMASIDPVNPLYHNNRDWAIANKIKGRNATLCAVGSTVVGCIKTFTEKGSFANRILDFGQKVLEGLRNLEQYLLYGRGDDDAAKDKATKPLAGLVGSIACTYETKVNPLALPLTSAVGGKVGEAYSVISNWFNLMWWRLRLAVEKINWELLKAIPVYFKRLFHNDLNKRKDALKEIKDIISPIFGLAGSFFVGIFVPIKAWNKLKEDENKWIEALADSGVMTQHAAYVARFTLEELFKAQETGNKNSWYLAGIGAAGNIMNIALPLVNVLPFNERTKILWRELAQGLARIFFSSRRNINGNEWISANV